MPHPPSTTGPRGRPDLSSGAEHLAAPPAAASCLDRKQLGLLLAIVVPLLLLWPTWVAWPLKILVVFFHELSHGAAAALTGGGIVRIEVDAAQGGLCVTRGGNGFLILSAGYLGSLLWGGLALLVSSRTRVDRAVSTILGCVMLAVTFLWIRPVIGFGFGFHLVAGLALLVVGARLPERVNDILLKVFGLASCLYVVPDIWSDTIARSGLRSDARMLAEMTHVPTVIWGGIWIVVAVLLTGWFLSRSCRTTESA